MKTKFKSIKIGEDFKLYDDSALVYTKKTKKDAICKQADFGICLALDQVVFAQDK